MKKPLDTFVVKPYSSFRSISDMSKTVKIVQDESAPVEREVLAQAIVNISKSFDKLLRSGLNKRAVIILIAYETKLGIGQIENVIGSLERLDQNYTR